MVSQVTALIEAHPDVFAAMLKEEVTGLTISSLQELAIVTALIAQSGVGECVLKSWKVGRGNTGIHIHVCYYSYSSIEPLGGLQTL